MMEKFKKYFYPIPMVLLIGSVLNPSFKMKQTIQMIKLLHTYMGICDDDINEQTLNDLKAKINSLYLYYSYVIGSNAPPVAEASHTNPIGEDAFFNPDRLDFWGEMSSSQSTSGINEYDVYNTQTLVKVTGTFNPVIWWKENAHTYPILSTIAKDVLNIPISSVSSESAFSQGRQQLGDHRHSLASTALEVLVCLRDWIQSERRNQGRAEIQPDEDEELLEIEEILATAPNNDTNSPPEDNAANINMADIINRMQNL